MTLEEVDLKLEICELEKEAVYERLSELQSLIEELTDAKVALTLAEYKYNRLIQTCISLDRPERGEMRLYSNNEIIMNGWELIVRESHLLAFLANLTTGEACILDHDDYDFEVIRFPWESEQ